MGEVAARAPHRSTTLHVRVAIVTVAYLVVFLASSVVAGLTVRSWTQAVEERGEIRLMRDDVGDLRLALSEQESGVHGYMRSGDPEFLVAYRNGLTQETAAIDWLEVREDLVEGAAADLGSVRAAAGAWRLEAVEPQIERRRDGAGEDPALIELDRVHFDEVRAALDDLDSGVEAEAVDSAARVGRARRNAVAVMSTAFGAALVCSVLAILLFRRWVTRPLAETSAAARAIAAGRLATMPAFDAIEFGDVADAIDSLQRSLSDERDRAVRAYKGLEQSAVLALQVRSELADERAAAPAGWALASRLRAAEGFVAGDCYETGLLDQHTMYIVVIDVTGHGAKAALSALKAKAQLRSALRTGLSPGDAVGWLAREHHDDAVDDFVTAFVAVVDVASGECRWANAGHPPALVLAAGAAVELPHSGPLIGPFDSSWSTETVAIPPGGTVVVYTDGLTEVRGESGSRLGEKRLYEHIATTAGEATGPDEIVESLVRLVEDFRVGSQTDDVTIVALTRSARTDDDPRNRRRTLSRRSDDRSASPSSHADR